MSNILLDTGTGELEIMEFVVENRLYAINVLKLKGIIQIKDIVPMPQSSSEIRGISNIRGQMVPIIDLKVVLHKKPIEELNRAIALLCEFNGTVVAFLVDQVKGIKRIEWKDIKRNSLTEDPITIGTLLSEENIVLLLDFESITTIAHIGTAYSENHDRDGAIDKYAQTPIILAEDSNVIAEMLIHTLQDAGLKNIKRFINGQDAKDFLFEIKERYGENFKQYVGLVITDIEMPILDGYTLTKNIKEDNILSSLPVIIFSSLITEELMHKGKSVGADVQINKPSTKELINSIYMLLEGKNS
ncbi:chemotaxis protein [Niameybacter massiliensis]|uniref:Stage 0 sporulation protein A homolog n=1 Tax=Holtiella tumoricola TaxID=3018743 RepID=A0AA42J0F6_9FIRM|nr:chemotaxis protein [Holtiella tumoricola]MDA3731345.1 chemotaxis protein [Holtiella tumoricola]